MENPFKRYVYFIKSKIKTKDNIIISAETYRTEIKLYF